MYYIDEVLYPEVLESTVKQTDLPPTTASPATTFRFTTNTDIEQIPPELITESNDSDKREKDILLRDDHNLGRDDDDEEDEEDDDEIITPRALPVHFFEPPKK